MNIKRHWKAMIAITMSVIIPCCTPNVAEVKSAAPAEIAKITGQEVTILQVKSDFNEGNGDPSRVIIWAASKKDAALMFGFNANYKNGKLLVDKQYLQELVQKKTASLSHTRQFNAIAAKHFKQFSAVVNPNKKGPTEIKLYLYQLPCTPELETPDLPQSTPTSPQAKPTAFNITAVSTQATAVASQPTIDKPTETELDKTSVTTIQTTTETIAEKAHETTIEKTSEISREKANQCDLYQRLFKTVTAFNKIKSGPIELRVSYFEPHSFVPGQGQFIHTYTAPNYKNKVSSRNKLYTSKTLFTSQTTPQTIKDDILFTNHGTQYHRYFKEIRKQMVQVMADKYKQPYHIENGGSWLKLVPPSLTMVSHTATLCPKNQQKKSKRSKKCKPQYAQKITAQMDIQTSAFKLISKQPDSAEEIK